MIVLDTHALVWWVSDPKRVPPKARRLLDAAVKADDPISVSSSSPIQLTFVVLFGLCLAAAAQIVWLLRRRPISPMA